MFYYHIATKISSIYLPTRTPIFAVSVQWPRYDNIALQCKYEKKIQNGWFTKPSWKSTETTCSRLSHSNTFDWIKSKFREFPCWFWDRNFLYWHQNIRIKFLIKLLIKFRLFWCQLHVLYANESRKIRITKTKHQN